MAKTGKSGGGLKRSPIHLLHRALQLSLDFYAQETGAGGVTQRQYAVLCAVAADDGLSQARLVKATGIDRSTVAELVARMSGLGLLERQRALGDGRANTVRLTERGRTLLEQTEPRVVAADKRLLKLLPSKKRDDFLRLLQDLVKEGGAPAAEAAAKAAPRKKAREPRPEATAAK